MTSVAVIGGGLAGLSAALSLVDRGFRVFLFERRPYAGGRTFSFQKEFWPHPIDNGPHVLIGAYQETLRYLEKLETARLLSSQKRLTIPFQLTGKRTAVLRATSLPSPFHLLAGLSRFPLLGRGDLFPLLKAAWRLKRKVRLEDADSLTVNEWLDGTGQTPAARRFFWQPLTLATLNAEAREVSFYQLVRVMQEGFLKGKSAGRLFLMPSGLTATLVEPAVRKLQESGAVLRFAATVRQITARPGQPVELLLSNGETFRFPAAISALPAQELVRRLQPGDEDQNRTLHRWRAFRCNTILNLHLWTSQTLTNTPMTCLIHGYGQWLFREKDFGGLRHYTIVVSGADELLEQKKGALVALLLRELEDLFPEFSSPEVSNHYLTVFKTATPLCSPGMEGMRPVPGTTLGNLFLAGDWTRTGLPPTIESAVRSGVMAAARLSASLSG